MRALLNGLVVPFAAEGALVSPGKGHFAAPSPVAAIDVVADGIDCDASVALSDVQSGLRALAGLPGADCLATSGDVNCRGARTHTFLNPFAGAGEEFAKVQALVKINGAWEGTPETGRILRGRRSAWISRKRTSKSS